jgi:hypothetical protein
MMTTVSMTLMRVSSVYCQARQAHAAGPLRTLVASSAVLMYGISTPSAPRSRACWMPSRSAYPPTRTWRHVQRQRRHTGVLSPSKQTGSELDR